MSIGAMSGFPKFGATIFICGLSASLSALEWQLGVPLSSLRSRVLKSSGSFGPLRFQVAASLLVTRPNVALAARGPATGSAANVRTAKPVNMKLVPQIRIRLIIVTSDNYWKLSSKQYIHGPGAAVDGPRRHKCHDFQVPAQPQVDGCLEHGAADARAVALAVDD